MSGELDEKEKRVEVITNALLHLPIRGKELEFAARQVELALSQGAYLAASPSPSMEMGVVANLRSDAAQLLRMSKATEFGEDLSVRVTKPDLLIANMVAAADALVSLAAQVQRLTEENEALRRDAARYAYLREQELDAIHEGGVFAGLTPDNVVLNGVDLDQCIDSALKENAL